MDDELDELDLDSGSDSGPSLEVGVVTANPELGTGLEACGSVNISAHNITHDEWNAEDSYWKDVSAIAVVEIRLTKASKDLQILTQLRSMRPMLPIFAVTTNDDPDFQTMIFEAGCNDILTLPVNTDVLAIKANALATFAESGKVLEMKNNEVIATMKSLREANQKLKSEMDNRIQAESDKAIAEETARRHEQIREIMDSLPNGFFTIEKGMIVGDTTSLACEEIFGQAIAGQSLGKGILNLEGHLEDHFAACVDQLFDNFMPRDIALDMVPSKVTTKSGKIVRLSLTVQPNDESLDPEKIIVVAADITKQEKERTAFQESIDRTQALIHILQHRRSFAGFLNDFVEKEDELKQPMNLALLKRVVHTIKGNAGAFGLKSTVKSVDELESQLSEKELPDEQKVQLTSERLDIVTKPLKDFLSDNFEIIEMRYGVSAEDPLVLKPSDLDPLKEFIASFSEVEEKEKYETVVKRLYDRPISELIATYRSNIQTLSSRLGKEIEFKITGDEIRIDHHYCEPVFASLIHAVRNATDHGVENPDDREASGKTRSGLIELSFKIVKDGYLDIELKDDGKGINPDVIRTVAKEKEILPENQLNAMSERELQGLIFHEGFSTAETISDISGRGVGMAALKIEVETIGGTLDIMSTVGKGTSFLIQVPLAPEKSKEIAELKTAS